MPRIASQISYTMWDSTQLSHLLYNVRLNSTITSLKQYGTKLYYYIYTTIYTLTLPTSSALEERRVSTIERSNAYPN